MMQNDDRNLVRDIPVVILAGGRGTRLMEETTLVPKPMVTIGGAPMLYHIMRYYGYYGFRRFIICLGYKGWLIKEFFMNLRKHVCNVTIHGGSGAFQYIDNETVDWQIDLVETDLNTLTALRIKKVEAYINFDHFCLTYGDGLTDLDLLDELRFHHEHGKIGTVAAVHPPSRFGNITIAADHNVISFREKKPLANDYINGGYFIFRSEFLTRLSPTDNVSLESQPLCQLAEDGQLSAYTHDGFWQCMDTLRDRELLEELYVRGVPPWQTRRTL